MSDVSGIPNMGFGGGNFFAPQFSYNPQMSAGQASAAYMPAENYAQNVTNNIFSSGGGFGRQTDYYSGLGAQYSAAGMSPYGVFGEGGGGGASPYQTSNNVFETGAAPFQGGGGSSGMGGSIYGGGGSFSGGSYGGYGGDSFGSFGGGRQDPYPNMSMPGGLNSSFSSPSGAGAINWDNLFGGGGPRNDPSPGMAMPGGLGSPMTMPAPTYGSLGGDTFGNSSAPSYDRIAQTFQDLAAAQGGGLSAPTMPSSKDLLGYTPDVFPTKADKSQDQPAFDFSGGVGGTNAPAMPDAQKLLGYEPQQWPAEFDPNTFQSPANRYDQFQGPGQSGGGQDTDLSSSNKSAEKIAEEARARLADLIGSPETAKAVEDAKTTPDAAAIPLPRERPAGADAARPPADVPPQDLTYLQGKGPGDLKGVNARFAKALQEFTREYNASQGDYSIALRSGLRGADQGFHGSGKAMDINLIDRRTGERLNDYQTRDPVVFRAYQDNANQFHSFLEKNYPDLAQNHRWGGYFWNGGPGGYGSQDIMHHDLGADRIGMGAGSWQGGLDQRSADAYGLPTGGGLRTPPPQFTFDWSNAPIKDAPPIQQTYKSADGTRLYQLAEDGTRIPVPMGRGMNETTEYDPFRGTQLGGIRERSGLNEGEPISRPPADIPSGTPFVNDGTPFGPPAPAGYTGRPAGPSGVEKSQTFLNRSLESILTQYAPEKLSLAGTFLDIKQPLREALKGPMGSQILDGLQPKLGSVGLTRDDFAKAVADPRARFGEPGGFGPYPEYTGPEPAPGGYRFNPEANVWETTPTNSWADFRRSDNIDDQRGLPNSILGQAVTDVTNAFYDRYSPEPPLPPSTPLGRDLGIGGDAAPVSRFFGSDENIANRKLMPGELSANWNKNIYEATDRPTMARDESLGPDPNPFTGFRQSENIDDRRFDPELTDEQRKTLSSVVARGQYLPDPNAKTPEGGELGRWAGTGNISNLEANSDARRMATQGAARTPRAMGDGGAEGDVSDGGFNAIDAAASEPTSMRDFPSPANDYSAFQQPASRADLAKTMLTPEFMDVIKEVESSGDPNKVTGKYKGLYQLDDKEFRKYGGKGDIFNPEQNTKAASAKMIDENQRVQNTLGRALTPPEQYMVHNQGVAGSLAHLANPDELAWKNFQGASGRSDASAKEAIWKNMTPEMKREFGNDVNNVTSRDFMRLWEDRYYGILHR